MNLHEKIIKEILKLNVSKNRCDECKFFAYNNVLNWINEGYK